jgi:hypothetical protein
MQNYLLLGRSNTGAILEKVNLHCALYEAQRIIQMMMECNNNIVRGQVIEGNRAWIGDFSVKPVWEIENHES